MKYFALCAALVALVVSGATSTARADRYRYIDESGNIHWVERFSQVPERYRNQLLKPTPIPTGKEGQEWHRQQMTEYKQRMAEQKREEKLRRDAAEKAQKAAARKAASPPR